MSSSAVRSSEIVPSDTSPVPTPPPESAASAADAGSTVVPAELDAQSAEWFESVCTSMDVALPTAPGDLPSQDVIDYVKALSAAMIATGQLVTTLPPPTVEGGVDLATALSASMSGSGTDLAAKVDSYLTDLGGVNAYSAQSTVLAKQLLLPAAFEPLTSLDPAVNAALHQFPACRTYGF